MTLTNIAVILLVVCGGLVVCMLVAWAIGQLRLLRHHGVLRDEFVRCLSVEGVSAEVSGVVYDFYKARAIWKSFGISPEDTYEGTFLEGTEEIRDDAEALLRELGIFELPDFDPKRIPIRNIRDMVMWLDFECRRERQNQV